MNIFDIIKFEEGFSSTPYVDTEGYVTIGYGTKISTKNAPLEYFTLEISEEVAERLVADRLRPCLVYLYEVKNTQILGISRNSPRFIILQSMCYQLGEAGLDGFKKMWAAIEKGDWEEAAKEALDSKWATQTPERARRHAEVLRTGMFSY